MSENISGNDYGEQIWKAFLAIQQLHADCDKLLQDCDGVFGKNMAGKARVSLFNTVTRDLSKAIGQHKYWMPSALYRYYDAADECPGLVEALTICFQDEDVPMRHTEPLLAVGRIQYVTPPTAEPPNYSGADASEEFGARSDDNVGARPISHTGSVCKPWDLWKAYFFGIEPSRLSEVIYIDEAEIARMALYKAGPDRIAQATLIVQPLYSIQSIEDVTHSMALVRQGESQHSRLLQEKS